MELLHTAPRGVFPSEPNMFTPHIIGYAKGTVNGRVAWIELSWGESIMRAQEKLYGVTFRRADGSELWREGPDVDPSTAFGSRLEAEELIERYL